MAGLGLKSSFGPIICVRQHLANIRQPSKCVISYQRMFISSKIMRDKFKVERPKPFPYKDNKYNKLACIFDSTLKRFDENTKLLVVEGNIAAGKTTFAKELAEQLDMLYLPEVTADMEYINAYGHDLRDYASLIPESIQPFDIDSFYKTPNHKNVASFQLLMYRLRFFQYVDALAHIMNTGQGVVLERCAHSDSVFVETMAKFGYLSKLLKRFYYELRTNTITELMRPNLIIYLDVPVNILQERIKKRGIESEVNTNVLSAEYLQTIEDQYKQNYLKDMEKHCEMLIYDWSEFGEVEEVVEDIERIDFYSYGKHDLKNKDWRLFNDSAWSEARYLYTTKRSNMNVYFHIPHYWVPELQHDAEDMKEYVRIHDEVVPGNRYQIGYNADMGDTGIITKMRLPRLFK
ncbi:NADH dehydrogenase (Ubiquinone) 1 alpha subcomplex [Chamberlinius hualienensis]